MVTKQIQSVVLEDLLKSNIEGTFPFLITINAETTDVDLKALLPLRLISDNMSVKYQRRGDTEPQIYYPSCLTFTPPSINGKEVGSASLGVSAIDYKIIEIIRSLTDKPRIDVVAGFMKRKGEAGHDEFLFSEINCFSFVSESVQWDKTAATFSLIYDNTMKLNVPKSEATVFRFPACYEDK